MTDTQSKVAVPDDVQDTDWDQLYDDSVCPFCGADASASKGTGRYRCANCRGHFTEADRVPPWRVSAKRKRDERFREEVGPGERIPVPVFPSHEPSPVITLCGSMRFYPQMMDVAAELTSAGAIVLMPHRVVPPGQQDTKEKKRLDRLHREKIDMSDHVVVVTNPQRYIGESTSGEIDHSHREGKPVTLCIRSTPDPL